MYSFRRSTLKWANNPFERTKWRLKVQLSVCSYPSHSSLFICSGVLLSLSPWEFHAMAKWMRCILWPMNLVSWAILRCEHNHKINKLGANSNDQCKMIPRPLSDSWVNWPFQARSQPFSNVMRVIDHWNHVPFHQWTLCLSIKFPTGQHRLVSLAVRRFCKWLKWLWPMAFRIWSIILIHQHGKWQTDV